MPRYPERLEKGSISSYHRAMKKKSKIDSSKLRHDELPASVGLVKEIRNELLAEIRSLDHKLGSVDHRVDSLDHKVDSLDHKVDSLEHKVDSLEHRMMAKFEESLAVAHRTQVLMEEQRNENRIVFDGLKTFIERQNRMETELAEVRQTKRYDVPFG
jgi:uncharacterized protein YhaN